LVDGERLLAVASEPAEAAANGEVTYRALFVAPDGAADPAALGWSLCTEQKPLAVTGPIPIACQHETGKALMALGEGESATATLSADVCRTFGPTPPAPKKDEPNSRPADPDTTGGYYQPVRVNATIEGTPTYAVGVTRLSCGLAGATQEQAATYNKQHQPNANPALTTLVIRRGHAGDEEVSVAGDADAPRIKPGASITLRASWMSCPKTPECGDGLCSPGENKQSCADDCDQQSPQGCTGAEPYQSLNPLRHELEHRHEAIRVSWFASDGRFEHERTGRAETETDHPYTDNEWTAPTKHGELSMWVVIRDDRGGVGWSSYKLDVEP
jgi:hypothetical protein